MAGQWLPGHQLRLDKGIDIFSSQPVIPGTVRMDDNHRPVRAGLITVHQGRFDVWHEAAFDELLPKCDEKIARSVRFAPAERTGIDANKHMVAKLGKNLRTGRHSYMLPGATGNGQSIPVPCESLSRRWIRSSTGSPLTRCSSMMRSSSSTACTAYQMPSG